MLEAAPPDRVRDHLDLPGVIIDAEVEKLAPEAQAILRQSHQSAADLKVGFDALLDCVAADIGRRACLANLKGSARPAEKIEKDYEGGVGKIKNLLGAAIEVDTVDRAGAIHGCAAASPSTSLRLDPLISSTPRSPRSTVSAASN